MPKSKTYSGTGFQRIERSHLPTSDSHGSPANDIRNPLAVWVDLDELTEPNPGDGKFFGELAERIADLGVEAGMSEEIRRRVVDRLKHRAPEYLGSIQQGKVREYVKIAANDVMLGVHGS